MRSSPAPLKAILIAGLLTLPGFAQLGSALPVESPLLNGADDYESLLYGCVPSHPLAALLVGETARFAISEPELLGGVLLEGVDAGRVYELRFGDPLAAPLQTVRSVTNMDGEPTLAIFTDIPLSEGQYFVTHAGGIVARLTTSLFTAQGEVALRPGFQATSDPTYDPCLSNGAKLWPLQKSEEAQQAVLDTWSGSQSSVALAPRSSTQTSGSGEGGDHPASVRCPPGGGPVASLITAHSDLPVPDYKTREGHPIAVGARSYDLVVNYFDRQCKPIGEKRIPAALDTGFEVYGRTIWQASDDIWGVSLSGHGYRATEQGRSRTLSLLRPSIYVMGQVGHTGIDVRGLERVSHAEGTGDLVLDASWWTYFAAVSSLSPYTRWITTLARLVLSTFGSNVHELDANPYYRGQNECGEGCVGWSRAGSKPQAYAFEAPLHAWQKVEGATLHVTGNFADPSGAGAYYLERWRDGGTGQTRTYATYFKLAPFDYEIPLAAANTN